MKSKIIKFFKWLLLAILWLFLSLTLWLLDIFFIVNDLAALLWLATSMLFVGWFIYLIARWRKNKKNRVTKIVLPVVIVAVIAFGLHISERQTATTSNEIVAEQTADYETVVEQTDDVQPLEEDVQIPYYWLVIGEEGYGVDVFAGAGFDYGVIGTVNDASIVSRDLNREIIFSDYDYWDWWWIPVEVRETTLTAFRGYIFGWSLDGLSHDFQRIFPERSAVNPQQRARLQQRVDEIDAMALRRDTLHYRIIAYEPLMMFIEFLYFDETERVRKYFWSTNEDGDFSVLAYYDAQGNLINITYRVAGDWAREENIFWLHEGRIVDFRLTLECFTRVRRAEQQRRDQLRQQRGQPVIRLGSEQDDREENYADVAERLRVEIPIMGNELETSAGHWGGGVMPLTSFLTVQSLLSEIKSDEYRGRLPDWIWEGFRISDERLKNEEEE